MEAQNVEVQGLLAQLNALGYAPKPPPDLGHAPNFEFVADCLLWLCQRAAPELSVARDYGSEAARVAFMTSLGSQLFARTRIRVNLRRLYRSGGSALRELRRLAALLLDAATATAVQPAAGAASQHAIVARLTELAQAGRSHLQGLPQHIGGTAVQLVGALAAAPGAATEVSGMLASITDVAALQHSLQAATAAAHQQVAQLEQAVAVLGQEQQMLEARIEKRHVELDRVERRLDALAAVRPAHSAQVEALEAELAGLYQCYLHKFRNLEYLEGQLDKYGAARQAEADEADRQLRRIQRQVAAAEEARLLQGGADQNGSPNAAGGGGSGEVGDLDSEDSEEQLGMGGWGPKGLPRLAAGAAAAPASGTGSGGGATIAAMGGPGKKAGPAAALDLQLLPEEDSGASTSVATGRSRLSNTSTAGNNTSAAGGAQDAATAQADGRGGSRVTFGGASLIPAHRGGSGSGGGAGGMRPTSSRRATGSGSALLRKAAAGGYDAGEDGGAALLRASMHEGGGAHNADNDF